MVTYNNAYRFIRANHSAIIDIKGLQEKISVENLTVLHWL